MLNAAAGTLLHGDGEAICSDLERRLSAAHDLLGFAVVPPDGMQEAMEAAFGSDAELVLIGGGDGTIQHAAKLAIASGKTLGILPLGTLNMLARELHIPLDLSAAADALGEGEVRLIDVADVGGELCLLKAMAGRLSASIRLRERRRRELKALAWLRVLWAALRSMVRRGRSRFLLTVDGQRLEVRTVVLIVSLNRFSGELEHPFARDRLDGGRLVVYGLSAIARREDARVAVAQARERGLLDRFIIAEGREVVLASRHSHIHLSIDGEIMLFRSPVEMKVKPRALSVLMPAEHADRAAPPGAEAA